MLDTKLFAFFIRRNWKGHVRSLQGLSQGDMLERCLHESGVAVKDVFVEEFFIDACWTV